MGLVSFRQSAFTDDETIFLQVTLIHNVTEHVYPKQIAPREEEEKKRRKSTKEREREKREREKSFFHVVVVLQRGDRQQTFGIQLFRQY